jgi:hypothetical protein
MNYKELLSDALPIIERFAPTIATVIGGPFGFLSGSIIPILTSAFGVKTGDLKSLASNILNDPDAQNKLATLENNHGDLLSSILNSPSINNLANAEINIKLAWQQNK